jgi:hypothetical protein
MWLLFPLWAMWLLCKATFWMCYAVCWLCYILIYGMAMAIVGIVKICTPRGGHR